MSQNLVSLGLTAAEKTALHDALQTIRTTLGNRAVSLTQDQRRSLVKMGEGSRAFCEQAVPALQQNSGSLPGDFPLAELVQDMADYPALSAFIDEYTQIGELLGDTQKALASDIMYNTILGVGALKVANKINPAIDTLLKDLRSVRRAKPKSPPTKSPGGAQPKP
jgi:hypothetical protein